MGGVRSKDMVLNGRGMVSGATSFVFSMFAQRSGGWGGKTGRVGGKQEEKRHDLVGEVVRFLNY